MSHAVLIIIVLIKRIKKDTGVYIIIIAKLFYLKTILWFSILNHKNN